MPSKVKNYLIILLALSTVACGVIAFTQSRRLSALQDELLKASAEAAKVKPRATNEATAPVAASEKPAEGTPAAVEPAAEPATEQRPQRNRDNRANMAALMANPEFAQAWNLQQRAALDARYAELFKKLNLTPAQLEQFKSLLIERQNARMDVMAAVRENGLSMRENRDEINKLVSEAQAEVDANIKTSLGESVYNQYQNYDSTQSQRNLVKQLDERLAYTATTLNSTQADFLVSALSTGATAASNEPGFGPGNWGGGGSRSTITDAVIEQAANVLTPAQVAALKQLQTEQQAQQKIRELTRPQGQGSGR